MHPTLNILVPGKKETRGGAARAPTFNRSGYARFIALSQLVCFSRRFAWPFVGGPPLSCLTDKVTFGIRAQGPHQTS
jgi:hypothetical protein